MKGFERKETRFSLCGLNCGLCVMRTGGYCPGCGGGRGTRAVPWPGALSPMAGRNFAGSAPNTPATGTRDSTGAIPFCPTAPARGTSPGPGSWGCPGTWPSWTSGGRFSAS